MKKILLSAAMMVAAVSFASAQQWFVGGSLGFENSKKEFLSLPVDGLLDAVGIDIQLGNDLNIPLGGGELKTMSYSILPKFGYIFNESWMVGLGLGYSSTQNKFKTTADGGESMEVKITPNMFMVNPYVRYTAWQLGRFSLAFQGDVNVGFGDMKIKMNGEEAPKTKTMAYGVNIAPVVQFDLSCNVMLESKFNFANLGYNYKQIKTDGVKSTNSGFDFGANADNAFTTGDVTVGFIVKF